MGELWFTTTSQSEVGGCPVDRLAEIEYDELVNSEVDDLVKTRTKFDCPVEGLKYGIG